MSMAWHVHLTPPDAAVAVVGLTRRGCSYPFYRSNNNNNNNNNNNVWGPYYGPGGGGGGGGTRLSTGRGVPLGG